MSVLINFIFHLNISSFKILNYRRILVYNIQWHFFFPIWWICKDIFDNAYLRLFFFLDYSFHGFISVISLFREPTSGFVDLYCMFTFHYTDFCSLLFLFIYLFGYNLLFSIYSSTYSNLTSYHTTPLKRMKLMAFLFSSPVDTYLDSCYSSSQKHLHNCCTRHSLWLSCHHTLLSPVLLFFPLFPFLIPLLLHIQILSWLRLGLFCIHPRDCKLRCLQGPDRKYKWTM